MSTNFDHRHMRLAIDEARIGSQQEGAGEVGCVIARDGEVLARGHNESGIRNDPTAHAEIVTIRRLCAKLNKAELKGCTLYCTLQPCGMCTLACVWAGISRIVYGAGRSDANAIYFETRNLNTDDFVRDCFRPDMEVTAGVLEDECRALYAQPDEDPGENNPAHEATETV